MILLIVLLTLVYFLWQGLENDPYYLPSPLINKPFPEFEALDFQKSHSILRKKIFLNQWTLLTVWSSWCLTCVQEQSLLLNLKKKNAISIYGLNYRDELKQAKQWLKHYGNPFQKIIFDPEGTLAIDLGTYGVPENYLIDPNGIIRYKHIGPLNAAIWIEKLQPFLKHRKHQLM